jgi:hypothetical protein
MRRFKRNFKAVVSDTRKEALGIEKPKIKIGSKRARHVGATRRQEEIVYDVATAEARRDCTGPISPRVEVFSGFGLKALTCLT